MSLEGFLPVVQRWFRDTLGAPSAAQAAGWPAIRAGRNTLIAAPTGSGKTLAAFLHAIDSLLRRGDALPDATQVIYVSPLRALGNDVQKNLLAPLASLRELDPTLPEIRVLVRSGDTPSSRRQAMQKRPPHVLVTTPESLYILLTSDGGRSMLGTARTVILDEIHAVAGDKRGAHLALSLERLVLLTGEIQRIGLSATQKPLADVANLLVGEGRACELVDVGHRRELDLAMEIPGSELSTVCSHEVWEEIYDRMVEGIEAHRTTLVFVNTRKLAERVAARLTDRLGEDAVTSHHGSLSRERRLDAEQRLKEGRLRALVATASLELGIDVGDVDLVIQVGVTNSIATFLQRVGRAGHSPGRTPRGRIFPLTTDELVAGAALLRAVRRGELDRTPQPPAPLDVLAQQCVASCVPEDHDVPALLASFRRAWPYRHLSRRDLDAVLDLHTVGRGALLHRDGVHDRIRATRRARMIALTSGGAIPDNANYRVVLEPEGTLVGTVDEDFAIESSSGDVFQLGNASWRVLRVESGLMRVADAQGAPPSLPFWVGEAPSRTPELAAEICAVRDGCAAPDFLRDEPGVPAGAVDQIHAYVEAGRAALGVVPSRDCVVIERFHDESGGSQLVVHAPFGNRINRAWGLALRKRFCRGFGFELQAAADEEAILLSLGPQHSFPLEEVFDYLHPDTAGKLLEQALLPQPLFKTRWRWNVSRALLLPRMNGSRRVPMPIRRMRSDDLLVAAFPEVLACPETLTGPDLEIPRDHPLVRQTLDDCMSEAMDAEGFLAVLRRLRDGSIRRVAVDTPEPSAFARRILAARPYAFLDDAPLEERRTQAVLTRRALDPGTADTIGALDPEAVARVRAEAWPEPRDAEEVHEALSWMGYVTLAEAEAWAPWLEELVAGGRVVLDGDRWYAAESSRDPLEVLRGRMEALGPMFSDDPLLVRLETAGHVMRVRLEGREAWCDRRLLARIHRQTVDRLRREISPVTAAEFLRFLAAWQHVEESARLDGPRGVAEVLRQLAGLEVPAAAWEAHVLPARVRGYRREWLDELTLRGEFAWARLWGAGASPVRTTPVSIVPREDLGSWLALAVPAEVAALGSAAQEIHAALSSRGALFQHDLGRATGLLPSHLERGIAELASHGLVTCDSWSGLRQLVTPPSRRRREVAAPGRFGLLHPSVGEPPDAEFVARRLLARTGVVFRRTVVRERIPVPWRDLLQVLRRLELRGEVRGGRFVAGFDGEQYALPAAVTLLRQVRKREPGPGIELSAADPLNLAGILTPEDRVSPTSTTRVAVPTAG